MAKSVYIAGMGAGSGKSLVVLGVVELLARHGRRIGFFRPVVGELECPDPLTALISSRYDLPVPCESRFGTTHARARDLIARNREHEPHSQILEEYRGLARECDFVVCAGSDYKAMNPVLEFEFNVEVARNLGALLLAGTAGSQQTGERSEPRLHRRRHCQYHRHNCRSGAGGRKRRLRWKVSNPHRLGTAEPLATMPG